MTAALPRMASGTLATLLHQNSPQVTPIDTQQQ
jgi:hypothetical protein